MTAVSRRQLLAGAAGAALVRPPATTPARRTGLDQGTGLAVRLSPDGKRIAMDLVGVLWVLPAPGGTARRLTGDLFDIAQPDWAPDGSAIAFQSYRAGSFDLWTIRPDGSGLRKLTSGPFDHREPRFSPDGRALAFSGDRGGSYGIHRLDLASGAIEAITDTSLEEYEPAWSPDGTQVAFVVANTRIDVVSPATGARTTRVQVPAGQVVHGPEWTPDGTGIVYQVTLDGRSELWRDGKPEITGEEVFPFRVSFGPGGRSFLYGSDGAIHRRTLGSATRSVVGFSASITLTTPEYRKRRRDFTSTRPRPVLGIGSPVLSPDGRSVAFRALNDIWTMRIGQPPQPLTKDLTWWKSDPAWSPDGKYLSYSTDRGGKLDIWLRELATGVDRQLTVLPNAAAVSGSWSADSSRLAFLDQTGALYTVEVASGAVRKLFAATFEPGRPSWSADGRTIALAAIVPYSARYREGLSKILLVDTETGTGRYVDPLPSRSLQTRGDDGPVWSPDGTRMAFVVASVLWVVRVDADGTFAGTPRQLTDEVTDAPSWSGDSSALLYLNNGRLRLVPARGGAARDVPMQLTWANTAPRGRTVIRAGRLWDGVSRTLARDVTVVVEGHRIVSAGASVPADGRVVDARDSVVTPGLVDMHHHREMQGYAYGGRQGRLWLSLGITTTRSPGSPAYHMVEERESIQSGARIGPRYFATGEAVDGARIFYNFMRPTFSDAQVALELSRAGALDYDLMKSYVRLSPERQRRVIAWAHRRGIHATSHYHYPAFAFGGDGQEHVGATNRFGYSRTVTALGSAYTDVARIFVDSRATLTPTLFGAVVLLGDDDTLVEDVRVRTLYPSWERAALRAIADEARTTDQTVNRRNLARQVAHVARVLRGGGRVITGTDSPISPNAVSTHLNLRAMVAYGMTPWEALSTATRIPGEFLDEPIGRVAPGYYADLAILGGDPLTDIEQAANVRRVMAAGVLHDVPSLLAPFVAPRSGPAESPIAGEPAPAAFWWHDPAYVQHSRHACCSDVM
ncbi:amidohydrolase family protein [Actinoplanes sp. NPDC020271]|uniref:amidohydrolase family protein n=1 Tax=Actinoplanes sp. NPDC020271 TaxID=3363896 RepID=UPI0037B7C3F1